MSLRSSGGTSRTSSNGSSGAATPERLEIPIGTDQSELQTLCAKARELLHDGVGCREAVQTLTESYGSSTRQVARALATVGYSADAIFADWSTCLFSYLVRTGVPDIAQYFYVGGPTINMRDHANMTALHFAAHRVNEEANAGHDEVGWDTFNFLLRAGYDPRAKCDFGTPMGVLALHSEKNFKRANALLAALPGYQKECREAVLTSEKGLTLTASVMNIVLIYVEVPMSKWAIPVS